MTSKKAKNFYGAFGARLRRGPSALAFGHHQLLPVQLLPPGYPEGRVAAPSIHRRYMVRVRRSSGNARRRFEPGDSAPNQWRGVAAFMGAPWSRTHGRRSGRCARSRSAAAPCSSSTRSACTGSLPPASSPRGTREAFVLSNSNRPTSINCVHGFVNLRLSSHLFHKLDFFQWELIFVRHYNTGTCRLLWAYFGPLRFISQGLPNERRVLQ